MSGRHESWQVRRWAPTALNAVVALVPASAMLSAVGAAGTGYLMHRADIAAAGAGTAAMGLAVERLQNRQLRRRARRERWEWRAEREQLRDSMDELRADLADAHHTLNVLRQRIHALNERTTQPPRPGLVELAARQRLARATAALDDAPTMPLRRIGAAPAPAPAPAPAAAGAVAPAVPSLAPAASAAPRTPAVPAVPAAAAAGPALPRNPLTPGRGTGPLPVVERPTPAGPQRRRPLVTLGRPSAAVAEQGWSAFEPVGGHPPAAARPAATAAFPAAARRAAGAEELPAATAPERTATPAAGLPGAGLPPIALGPLATPPQLPALPLGPAEPVSAGSGLPFLPPGPRDPVSGPLAIIVDLPRESARPASSTLPRTAVDAMVWASMAQDEADELTVTLERLDDPDRGGRHGSQTPGEHTTPRGLVVVGASVVGDPEARARRGRHTA